MSDPTEFVRREMVAQINAVEGSREYLEAKHGQVWDTNELQLDFAVLGFAAPQPMALGHEELAELITAWPLLSLDLRVAILAIVRSAAVAEEAFLTKT